MRFRSAFDAARLSRSPHFRTVLSLLRRIELLLTIVLILWLSLLPISRSQASPQTDETALRALAGEFYAAWASEDSGVLERLWSARSPDLGLRSKSLQEMFAANEKIEARLLTIGKLELQDGRATMRVVVEMRATAVKTGKPAEGFGKMNRAMHFVRENDDWKIWREVAAEEDLAVALVSAKTDAEREAMLVSEKELQTVELRKALIAQGYKLRAQSDYPQALMVFQFTQAFSQRIGDTAGVAATLQGIGGVAYNQAKYSEALDYYTKSLSLSDSVGDRKLSAASLRTIAAIHYRQANYDLARQYYQKALDSSEALEDHRGAALSMIGIANIFYYQGQYDSALEYYQRVVKLSETTKDNEGIPHALSNIGLIHEVQANYNLALEHYQKSLALSQQLGDKRSIANALVRIGVVHYKQGNYSLALEKYSKSLSLFEEVKDKHGMGEVLTGIGAVHFMQGNFGLTIEYNKKSLSLKESIGDRQGIATALIGIGHAYRLQSDKQASLEYSHKGLSLAEAVGNRKLAANALNNIGLVHYEQGNYDSALEFFQKSLRLQETLNDKRGITDSLNNIASISHRQGNHRRALELAERVAAIAKENGIQESLWEACAIAGKAYQSLAQPERARQAFEEAIATIEILRGEVAGGERERQEFFENRVSPYHAMVELLTAQNKRSEAFSYAERAKARVLLSVLSGGRINITRTMNTQEQEQERKLKTELASINSQISREGQRSQPDQMRLSDLNARLKNVRLEYEAFQTTLYSSHPELRVQRGEAPALKLDEAVDLVPDQKTALLEYVVTDDKTYLFVLTDEQRQTTTPRSANLASAVHRNVYTLAIKRNDLADSVERLRQQLARRDLGFQASSSRLYDQLVKPALAELQGKDSLVIVPDGALWELPFQALQIATGRYLLQDFTISYVPSLSVLREMISLRKKHIAAKTSPTLLALGNPTLEKQTIERMKNLVRDGKLDPLPEAEREVKTLAELYGGLQSKVYIGVEAREDRLKADAGRFRVLHLATHGILNDANPMYSQIVLAQGSGGSNEDGLLEAWEIMKLDLDADLVVLSACETGRGRVGAGEGLIGLAWALFVAGTPTTVVSQWKVDSKSTTDLMIDFHRNLRAGLQNPALKMRKAKALREAALKMLRTNEYRHPFYWAGFVVVGDPG